jgi:hypothetical protein
VLRGQYNLWSLQSLLPFLLLVSVIVPITYSVASVSGPHKRQPQSVLKRKCSSPGFEVYEKWEKPGGLFPFYEHCKVGYIDARGTVVIPAQFEEGGWFHEQLAAVAVNMNEKLMYGYINQAGQFAIHPEFDSAHPFSDGLAGVRLGKEWGYIDRKGVVVIPLRFAEVSPFYRGLARVRMFTDEGLRGKWGCINKKGEFVVAPRYDHIQHFTEQIVVPGIFSNGQWKFGLISWTGKTIREPQFDLIGRFDEGVASIRYVGKGGLIKGEGQLIGNQKYDQALTDFSEGLIAVSIDRQVGYLNRRGEWAIPRRFNSAGAFSEGLAPVKIGEKFGYIDKTGKVVIEPQFDEAIEFSEGLARIRIERGYGFIDRKGVLRIRPRFNSVTPFRGAAALASMEGYDGYIDKKEEFIRRWP